MRPHSTETINHTSRDSRAQHKVTKLAISLIQTYNFDFGPVTPASSNVLYARWPIYGNPTTYAYARSELACLRAYRAAMPCMITADCSHRCD